MRKCKQGLQSSSMSWNVVVSYQNVWSIQTKDTFVQFLYRIVASLSAISILIWVLLREPFERYSSIEKRSIMSPTKQTSSSPKRQGSTSPKRKQSSPKRQQSTSPKRAGSRSPKRQKLNQLENLKKMTSVVADTGDLEKIKLYMLVLNYLILQRCSSRLCYGP